jgi:hypothetical protein
MNKEEIKETVLKDLFVANYFEELFATAEESSKQLKMHSNIVKSFFQILNLENIKQLVRQDKISEFIDVLVNFLKNNEEFSKKEKRDFLNGCENVLFLQSIMLEKNSEAVVINEFRVDKSIKINKNFLLNRIVAGQYSVIEKLFELSEDIGFDNDKILKLLFVHQCRDYGFFKRIISKYNLDINKIGDFGLDLAVEGSFVNAIALMNDEESNSFFNSFMRDYGARVDFNVKLKDLSKNIETNILEIIIDHEKLEQKEKLARLTSILTYGNISKENIEKLTKVIITENIISVFYENPIFDALFSNQNFNSMEFNREAIINNILSLDNAKEFNEVRIGSNETVNPTSMILDKFFRFSSPIELKEQHPLVNWLKNNYKNEKFSINTLITLSKYYKPEINDLGIIELNLPSKMLDILKMSGLFLPEKRGFLAKIFTKEKSIEVKEVVKSKGELVVVSNNILAPTLKNNVENSSSLDFNNQLFSLVKDKDILQFIDAIRFNAEQVNLFGSDNSEDVIYIKNQLPKFLNRSMENYFKYAEHNKEESKNNLMIQLKVLRKKTFEIMSRVLE